PTVIWPLLTTVPSIGFAVPAESSPLTTTSPSVSAVCPLASALREIVATVPLPLAPAVSATPLLRFADAIRTLPTDTLPLELSGVHCGSTVVSRPFAVAQFLKNVPSSTDSTSTMLLSKVRLNCAPRLTRSTFTTTSTVNASPTCTFFVDGEMLRLVLEEETGPGVGGFVWRSAAGRVVPVITVVETVAVGVSVGVPVGVIVRVGVGDGLGVCVGVEVGAPPTMISPLLGARLPSPGKLLPGMTKLTSGEVSELTKSNLALPWPTVLNLMVAAT